MMKSYKKRFITTYGEWQYNPETDAYDLIQREGYDYEGPVALAGHTTPTWRAEDWRFHHYNGGSSSFGTVWLDTENSTTNVKLGPDDYFRLRFSFGETGSGTYDNDGYPILQYYHDEATSPAWTNVGSSDGDGTKVYNNSHPQIPDGTNDSTERLTNTVLSGQTYQSGWNQFDSNGVSLSRTWSNDYAEYELSLRLNNASLYSIGDTIRFRVIFSETSTVAAFDTEPAITITAPTYEQDHWQICYPPTGSISPDDWTGVGSEDTSYEIPYGNLDTAHAICISLSNSGGYYGSTAQQFQLEYKVGAGGTWTNVNATSSYVRVAGTDAGDGVSSIAWLASNQRLTADEVFYNLTLDEVDGLTSTVLPYYHDTSCELYYGIQFRSADLSGGETIYLRVTESSDTYTVTYNVDPVVTIGSPPVFEAQDWRFHSYYGQSNEFGVLWLDSENSTSNLKFAPNEYFRFRFNFGETAGNVAIGYPEVQYYHDEGTATWTTISTTSSGRAAYLQGHFTLTANYNDSTQRLSTLTGAATYQGSWNQFKENATIPTARTWTDDWAEYEWSIRLSSTVVSVGDTLRFRLLFSGGSTVVNFDTQPVITLVDNPIVSLNYYQFCYPVSNSDPTLWGALGSINDSIGHPTYDTALALCVNIANTGSHFFGHILNLEANVDSAGWFAVTNSSNYVRYSTGSGSTDASIGSLYDATERRLNSTNAWYHWRMSESGTEAGAGWLTYMDIEIYYVIQLLSADLSGAETIEFRVYDNDSPYYSYIYSVTPTILGAGGGPVLGDITFTGDLDYSLVHLKTTSNSLSLDTDLLSTFVNKLTASVTSDFDVSNDYTLFVSKILVEALSLLQTSDIDFTNQKTTLNSISFNKDLDYTLQNIKTTSNALSLDVDLLSEYVNKLTASVTSDFDVSNNYTIFITKILVETLTLLQTSDIDFANQKTTLNSISFDKDLDYALQNIKTTSNALSLDVDLLSEYVNKLTATVTSDFDISNDYTIFISRVLLEALTLLQTSDVDFVNQKTTLNSISFSKDLDYALQNIKTTSNTLSLDVDLLSEYVNKLTATVTSDFDISNDYTIFVSRVLLEALTLLQTSDIDFTNQKTTLNSISFSKDLDYALQNIKTTNNALSLDVDLLSEYLNKLTAVATNNFDILNDFNISINTVLAETLTFLQNLDINLDVEKLATGSITFNNEQNQQTTIQLSGLASALLLLSLIQGQESSKDTSALLNINVNLSQFEQSQAEVFKAILFQLIGSQDNIGVVSLTEAISISAQLDLGRTNQLLGTANISLDTILDYNTTVQTDLLTAITYLSELDLTSIAESTGLLVEAMTFATNNIYTPEVSAVLRNTLSFINILSTTEQKQLLINKAVNLLTQLQIQQANTLSIVESINLIAQLEEVPTNTMTASKAVDLVLNAAQDIDVKVTYEEALLLTTQLLDNYTNVGNLTVSLGFDTNLQQQQTNLLNKVALITFSKVLDQVNTTQIDYGLSIQLVATLAETYIGESTGSLVELITFATNLVHGITPQVNYLESAEFISDLQTINTAAKLTSETQTFTTSLEQLQANLLDKALAMSFDTALNQINTNKVNFAAFVTFATILADTYVGSATGALVGAINFAVQLQEQNVKVLLSSKDISYDAALSQDGVPARYLFDTLGLSVQLSQDEEYQRLVNEFVQFETFLDEAKQTHVTFRPTINFNLEALEASATQKNTLASILMNLDTDIVAFGAAGLPAFISFAAQQDLVTDIKLVAEGELVLNTELTQTETYKLLGNRGITFGHILALTSLSRADLGALISLGTITDISVSGFVLAFTLVLPDGRTCKIKFEDRTTIVHEEIRTIEIRGEGRTTTVDEEDRVLKVKNNIRTNKLN